MRAMALLVSSAAILLPSAVHAVDGVVEINQVKALAGLDNGCDVPGFPVLICTPGSYRLTGNLEPAAGPVNVIEIDASGVTLDLNGFAILGGNTCSETGAVPNVVSCTMAGLADNGVIVTPSLQERIVVRNGSILGMNQSAVDLSFAIGSAIENIRASESGEAGVLVNNGSRVANVVSTLNGNAGIAVGYNCTVERSKAIANGASGFFTYGRFEGSQLHAIRNSQEGLLHSTFALPVQVRDSVLSQNGTGGIVASDHAVLTRNEVRGNLVVGIDVGVGSVIEGNLVRDNEGDGIRCAERCNVLHNTVLDNADLFGSGDGVESGDGSSAVGNAVAGSDGYLLNLGPDSGLSLNALSSPSAPGNEIAPTGAVSAGDNVCSGAPC